MKYRSVFRPDLFAGDVNDVFTQAVTDFLETALPVPWK